MTNLRAVVLLYRGPEITIEGVKNMQEYLATLLSLKEMPVLYSLDDEDIAKGIVSPLISNNNRLSETVSAEEHAVVYIGTKFKDVLAGRNLLEFATELSSSVTVAKITGADNELLTAVNIIGKSNISSVKAELLKRYNVTLQAFQVIQRIGKTIDV